MQDTRLERLVAASRTGYRTAEDLVMGVLRTAIITGVLRPGDRLNQDRLAGILEVSRVPVRSALRHLESDGLVTFTPHRGAAVSALSPAEIEEIYRLRAIVEPHAIRRSIAVVADEDVARLSVMVAEFEATSDEERWISGRRTFYEELYRIGNGPRVVDTIMRLRDGVGRYLLGIRVGHGSHDDLLGLVAERDADGAATFIERHLLAVASRLSEEQAGLAT